MRDNWTETAISDVAEVLSGFAFKSELFSEIDGIPLIRIRDLQKRKFTEVGYTGDYEERYLVNSGDFLIGMDGGFRCYEWLGPKALLNQRVCRIQSFDELEVIPRFVFFLVNQYLEKIEESTSFTTVKHISVKQVKDIRFPLPPLAEQRRIVDVVSSVDAYIDALQEQVDAARTVRNALGENAINSGYPVAKLSDIGRVITGSTPPTKRLEYWEPEEVDFVTAGDFGAQLLIKTASRMVSREGANVSRLLSSHSVMQVCIGATIGKVGYVSHEVVTNQQINSIVGLEELDAYFVALMLSTNEMQASIRDRAGTTTLPIISKSGWGELSIPWPDGSVRESISVLAKSIDEFVFETDRTVVEAKNLRSGLLSDLLSGEHEIPVSYDAFLEAA